MNDALRNHVKAIIVKFSYSGGEPERPCSRCYEMVDELSAALVNTRVEKCP
jgi:hypothetical protein